VLVPGKDVVWLEVPFSSQPGANAGKSTKLPNGKDYGFEVNNQQIVANKGFATAHPDAAKLFEIMKVDVNDINAQNLRMNEGEKSSDDIDRHVDAWIKANQKTYDGWLAQARAAAKK
jgi:glycine betaine/proline transport system substrate-binding protein